ncbi:MAG: apolipoprotein N-acyltransferase, partial [Gammaproteobacteria bacterium]|nr:apolipoprotein N-acyltransferase [Gammaproteobacteria bacterium]
MNYLLALGAGVLSVGAFAPFRWWWLLLVAMGILFLLWEKADRGRAFRLGLVFGLGQFGAGVYWVYVSIQSFGGMPPVLAGVCVFGLVFVLALFPAISGWLQAWFGGAGQAVRLGLIIP